MYKKNKQTNKQSLDLAPASLQTEGKIRQNHRSELLQLTTAPQWRKCFNGQLFICIYLFIFYLLVVLIDGLSDRLYSGTLNGSGCKCTLTSRKKTRRLSSCKGFIWIIFLKKNKKKQGVRLLRWSKSVKIVEIT